MPIPALLAAVLAGGGTFAATTALTTTTIAKGFLWKKIGMSFILGSFAGALAFAGRPKNPNAPGGDQSITSNLTESISSARFVYGECRVGGVIAYAGEKGKDLWLVMALSEGACEEITGLYIEGKKQTIRNDSGVVSVTDGEYAGHVLCYQQFAADGQTDNDACAALRAASDGEWTVNHRLTGISYVILKLTQGEGEPFDGVPEINFVIKGRKFIHPGVANFGTDQAVPVWTDNAAAVIYDYLRTRRGMPDSDIDLDSFRAAIPYCDGLVSVRRPSQEYASYPTQEKRYAANGALLSSDAVQGTMDELRWCIQGHVFEFDGRMHCLPGRPSTAVAVEIGDGDYTEEGIISYEGTPSISNRANVVNMSLAQSAQHDYQALSLPEKVDQVQLTRDGERHEKDLGQRIFTTSPSAADRLQETALQRARHTGLVTFQIHPGSNLKWLALKPGTPIRLTNTEEGFFREEFEIQSISLEEDMAMTITAEETSDDKYKDNPGLGEIPGRSLRIPRTNEPPDRIAAGDISVRVFSRYSDDGAFFWRVAVSVPESSLGFHARMEMGNNSPERQTSGRTVEFDLDHPPQDITVSVWRVSRSGKIGQERSVTVTPRYADVLPAPGRISWQATAGSIRIELTDPNVRAVAGAEFRYTSVPLNSTNAPSVISEATWADHPRLDSRTVLLQPGDNALFHINFTESGRYRIYARYVDSVGNAGPITELGIIALSAPISSVSTIRGAPDWPGLRNHLHRAIFGSDVPLIPDTAGDPSTVTGDEWENPVQARNPDKWQGRVYKTSESAGAWVDIAQGDRSRVFAGLANGVEHRADFRAVYNGNPTHTASYTFTPTAAAVVPPAPTLTGSGSGTEITLKSVIAGPEDSRARIQRHQYRYASTQAGLSSATWTSVSDSAALEKSFKITGLAENRAYFIQTRAVNSVGNGAASNTLQIFLGGQTRYGNWVRINPATIPAQGNLLAATDGVFRNSDATYAQWTETASGGAQTQHQIRVIRAEGGSHRSRTRASSASDWGSFSGWGNADAYTIDDFNSVDSSTMPRVVIAGTAPNRFVQGTVPSAVYNSRWIVYNEVDPGTGAWTKQIAVKHYQEIGAETGQQYRFERTVSIIQVASVPAKPTLTARETGFTSILLSGTTSNDGARSISRWEFRQATSESGLASAAWSEVEGASGTAFTHSVTGLTGSTTYFFQTRARNALGYSSPSDSVSESTRSFQTPSAPALTATASTDEVAVTLAASVTSNGGQAITEWEYRFATSTNGLSSASWTTAPGEAGNSMTETISTGLNSDTQYFFQVRATNPRGVSPVSNSAGARTIYVAQVPGKPTLTLSVNVAAITLSATATADSRSPITRWEYQEALTEAGLANATWITMSGQTGGSASITLDGKTKSTAYYYRVRCRNEAGTSDRSDAGTITTPFRVTAPGKPIISSLRPDGASFLVSASVTDDGGASISSWQARHSDSSLTLSSATWGSFTSASGTMISDERITGFATPGVKFVQVRASNTQFYSAASDYSSGTLAFRPEGVPTFGSSVVPVRQMAQASDDFLIGLPFDKMGRGADEIRNNGAAIDKWAYRNDSRIRGDTRGPSWGNWIEVDWGDYALNQTHLRAGSGGSFTAATEVRAHNRFGWSESLTVYTSGSHKGSNANVRMVAAVATRLSPTSDAFRISFSVIHDLTQSTGTEAPWVRTAFYRIGSSDSWKPILGFLNPRARFSKSAGSTFHGYAEDSRGGQVQVYATTKRGTATFWISAGTIPAAQFPLYESTSLTLLGIGPVYQQEGAVVAVRSTMGSATNLISHRVAKASHTLSSATWNHGDGFSHTNAIPLLNLDAEERYRVQIDMGSTAGRARQSLTIPFDTFDQTSPFSRGSGTLQSPFILGSSTGPARDALQDLDGKTPFNYETGGTSLTIAAVASMTVMGSATYRITNINPSPNTSATIVDDGGNLVRQAPITFGSGTHDSRIVINDFTVTGSGTKNYVALFGSATVDYENYYLLGTGDGGAAVTPPPPLPSFQPVQISSNYVTWTQSSGTLRFQNLSASGGDLSESGRFIQVQIEHQDGSEIIYADPGRDGLELRLSKSNPPVRYRFRTITVWRDYGNITSGWTPYRSDFNSSWRHDNVIGNAADERTYPTWSGVSGAQSRMRGLSRGPTFSFHRLINPAGTDRYQIRFTDSFASDLQYSTWLTLDRASANTHRAQITYSQRTQIWFQVRVRGMAGTETPVLTMELPAPGDLSWNGIPIPLPNPVPASASGGSDQEPAGGSITQSHSGAGGLSFGPAMDEGASPDEGASIDETIVGAAPEFSIESGNAQVTFKWPGPEQVTTADWPFGKIEGFDASFSATDSTYYDTEIEDLGESRIGRVTGSYELFVPTGGVAATQDEDVRMEIMHGDNQNSLTTTSLTIDSPSANITARYLKGRIWLRKLRNRGLADASWAFVES